MYSLLEILIYIYYRRKLNDDTAYNNSMSLLTKQLNTTCPLTKNKIKN